MALQRRLQLAVLCPYVPGPTIAHAGGQFVYAYLTELAKHADVVLIAPDDPENRRLRASSPVSVHLVEGTRQRNPLLLALQYTRDRWVTLTAGHQVTAAFGRDPDVACLLRSADLVEVQFTQYLPLAVHLLGAQHSTPLSVFAHDVWSQGLERRAQSSDDVARKLLARLVRRRVKILERDLLNLCQSIWTFSLKDHAVLQSLGVTAPLGVVDPPLVHPNPVLGASGKPIVLFVAALSRTENQDAMNWLAKDVWPRVLRRRPDFELLIAGEAPDRMAAELVQQGFRVTGKVPDLGPFYTEASVAVAPMLTGAGLKFKVPQAMAYALPVVSTTVGAEGLLEGEWATEDPFMAVTDDAATFANAIVEAVTPEGAEVGRRAADFVARRFSLTDAVTRVVERYVELVSAGT